MTSIISFILNLLPSKRLLVSACLTALTLSSCQQKVDHANYLLTKADSTKLDLTSYPEIRKEVTDYMHATAPDKQPDPPMFQGCDEDNIAVGPDGRRSIGGIKWKKNFEKEAVSFKRVVVIPGAEIIRLYNEGKTAVRSVLMNVTLDTPLGEINLDVMRNETYIKKGDQWCMVAGQGTEPYPSFIGKIIKKYGYPVIAFMSGILITSLLRKLKIRAAK